MRGKIDNSKYLAAAGYVKEKLEGFKPLAGIILGSGLGDLGERIENPVVIPYSEIPGFPDATNTAHKGNLIAGMLGGKKVIALQGRFHYYEGHTMDAVTLPVRVLCLLGIKYLFVSNAAGGLNPDYNVGDLMIIKDHINTLPNPLIGPNHDHFGTRFPDMTCAYDLGLIEKAEAIAKKMGIELKKGVYFSTSGPSYETPAEVRFYRLAGGDAVGMSTTPEVIVARHCNTAVFGMSVITNKSNTENNNTKLNDDADVCAAANAATEKMTSLFTELISSL